MKNYHRVCVFFSLIYCISCATTPEPKFYFPLTVVAGTADITVSITAKDQKEPISSEESRDMALYAHSLFRMEGSKVPDIPEKNYFSRISLHDRKPDVKTNTQPALASQQKFPAKLEKGDMLNFPIPPNAEVTVIVANNSKEPLQLVCTGKYYELTQGESRFFHFR
ncbi:MAG: hypothetical protein ACTTH7_06845 [Treponema sp.]